MGWVVVGGGAAGCVVAARLAEAGHDVTLLEAGPAEPSPATTGASFFDALAEPGRTFPGDFVRGRGLGGSGAVNGMLAATGDSVQYAAWGWTDIDEALARVRLPMEPAGEHELGPVDRALLAAAPDAVLVPLTRRGGRRVTAADAYLTDAVDVRTGITVDRVVLDGATAVGVALGDGSTVAADNVAVAAGAVGSPVLLARSGITVPGIGDGLRNHPAVPITLRLSSGVGVDRHGLVTAASLRRGDLQVLPLNHLGAGQPGLAMLLVVLTTPTGTGTVRPGEDGPVVKQVLSEHDRSRLTDGVTLAQRLLAGPAFAAIVADVTVGEPPAGIFHPTSTCAMGVVVDEDGAVRDHRHLHVVDASVFPEIPAAGTYLPTLLLAERLATRLTRRPAAPPSTPAAAR